MAYKFKSNIDELVGYFKELDIILEKIHSFQIQYQGYEPFELPLDHQNAAYRAYISSRTSQSESA